MFLSLAPLGEDWMICRVNLSFTEEERTQHDY